MARALKLRSGEGQTLLGMAGFLLLSTANTTVLSAAKNGLFLSVYPGDLIPHAVIAAALLTAAVAVVFTAVVAGTARRSLALGLTIVLLVGVIGSWSAFELNPRSAFAVYLILSATQVLVLTHAWDYVSDLLTGRQAKRLLPLIGMGASVGAIIGGVGVAPVALRLGTVNLLWISVGLLLLGLPILWWVKEPAREADESTARSWAVGSFLHGTSRGFRAIGSDKLLRLLAIGLIALTLTGSLIDLQLKFVLQEAFPRDRITAIYGLMSAVVGAGTLVLQLWASRVLFPKLGVSFAALLHGGLLAFAAGGAAVFGGVIVLAAAQALDDILQFSLQKPVEQVSLLPFPSRVKSVVLATLGGVLRPLAKATAGGLALALAGWPELLPIATVMAALLAFGTYTRHRAIYMAALESALARRAVDFSSVEAGPLVADASALSIIDRGLQDHDHAVVVFATSLLGELPAEDGLPRAVALLDHEALEVRAEAARVIGHMDPPEEAGAGRSLLSALERESAPFVASFLLNTIGTVGGVKASAIERFFDHTDARVRRSALTALACLGWPDIEVRIRKLLKSADPADQTAAAGCVGDLQMSSLVGEVAALVDEDAVRPVALQSLVDLGDAAVPAMEALVHRRELSLPIRRTVITALASVESRGGREVLVSLIGEPALGPAALTSLARKRNAGDSHGIDSNAIRPVLREEIQRGLGYSVAAGAIRRQGRDTRSVFVARELEGLRDRSVHRVLRMLGLSHDVTRIGTVSAALFSDDIRRRTRALELLEGTISSASAAIVIPFLEGIVDGLPADRAAELLDDAETIQADPTKSLLNDPGWYPRALALHLLNRDSEITIPGGGRRGVPKDAQMIPLIEKVMILKGSELFRNLPGSDLAGIASIATVVYLNEGDIVFELDDEGDAFYMVVQGLIRITRGPTELAQLGSREGFGEMAILDQNTRSATATAAESTTLLRIDRDSFDHVVEQNPAVARGVYRMLTRRLRNTNEQVASS
jgi:HEAT repeat protein